MRNGNVGQRPSKTRLRLLIEGIRGKYGGGPSLIEILLATGAVERAKAIRGDAEIAKRFFGRQQ